MALVRKMDHLTMEKNRVHGEVACTYSLFQEHGQPYLQIDTYGSATRKFRDKKSQSIQFGPEGIEQLQKILAGL